VLVGSLGFTHVHRLLFASSFVLYGAAPTRTPVSSPLRPTAVTPARQTDSLHRPADQRPVDICTLQSVIDSPGRATYRQRSFCLFSPRISGLCAAYSLPSSCTTTSSPNRWNGSLRYDLLCLRSLCYPGAPGPIGCDTFHSILPHPYRSEENGRVLTGAPNV